MTRAQATLEVGADQPTPMVDAEDVHMNFRVADEEVHALRGVSFRLPANSTTFIVGPSGSGKSTLLYLLGALDRPTSGSIKILGRDITAMTEGEQDDYRRNQVGFVYQSFNLIGNLSALDNVLLPYIPLGITRELRDRATDLLGQVGLGHRVHHRPDQLSGGQQQRVAIARALVRDPALLLADEPTGNLDRSGGDEIIGLLRGRGRTLVIVTHDRRFIRPGDIVLGIEDGRLTGVDVSPDTD
ncbi:ABC transporter ATP-binding protein [Tundrisphaera sp. TA3]|uniref:ABC transporter ATP-binding protein n=1 Tax=Tundrisphaera sp. TA3 TaxID=3435775 RepID=UPI003EBE309B